MTDDHDHEDDENREGTAAEGDDAADEHGARTDDPAESRAGDATNDPATEDEPLGDLARRLRERRAGSGAGDRDTRVDAASGATSDRGGTTDDDTHAAGTTDDEAFGDDEPASELFEEQEVAEVDTEQVWESVLGDDEETGTRSIVSELDDRVEATDDDAEHLVPKRAYCESCHYFSEPPTVACTYEGSSIVEVLDSEQFRVRNCPVVAGEIDTKGRRLSDRDPMSSVGDAE